MSLSGVEVLLSLPPGAAQRFADVAPDRAERMFVASDPPGAQLGSGGGTAHLLVEAWKAASNAEGTFQDWIGASRKLLIHGSGESRRLPAYAAEGKPLTPLPFTLDAGSRAPDQMLVDLQMLTYERFYWHAPGTYRLMVTCGDVLIRSQTWLPAFPDVDVLIVGLMASPEEAQRHGVMVCPADDPRTLSFFLQKPDMDTLAGLSNTHTCYLDTGIWLFSDRAIALLMARCGWLAERQAFDGGRAGAYDLYARFGPSLGGHARGPDQGGVDPDVNALRCAVLPLEDARFYHFGATRSLLTSAAQIRDPAAKQRSFGHTATEPRSAPIVVHADVQCRLDSRHRHLWIENSTLVEGWSLKERHVLTGIPPQAGPLALEAGVCLDVAPVGDGRLCIRPYGFDDAFRGPLLADTTLWLGAAAACWFERRGIDPAAAGLTPDMDLQAAPLFPLLRDDAVDPAFLQWMVDPRPEPAAAHADAWIAAERLSARDLLRRAAIGTIAARRRAHRHRATAALTPEEWQTACGELDLAAAAAAIDREGWKEPPRPAGGERGGLPAVHDRMFRCALGRGGADHARACEAEAFRLLREIIVGETALAPVKPRRNVIEDQIVWGRSPARLDLAGGWSDTPPYCLEHGGRVLNVAVNLNGQPPIQAFARIAEAPEIVVRSIDLGIEDRVTAYDDLRHYGNLGGGFGIARAALALAGFEPRFHAAGGHPSLARQLEADFGGGIEISMLAAVPKGSGLGTSSILAATLLGTLSDLCGLHWNAGDLFLRTLTLEQMLTSGGGWQDQAGGVLQGLKLLETTAGLTQRPVARWLPHQLFGPDFANRRALLYYTGITRVAHDILGEIVRRIFLNAAGELNIIEDIAANALYAADAVQRDDWPGLCEAVRRSWTLNQLLDAGTNPAGVQAILDRAGPHVAAAKLLGAGGGGYMLILAHDDEAGRSIRRALTEAPPNDRARFVDMAVSETGFQVTRS